MKVAAFLSSALLGAVAAMSSSQAFAVELAAGSMVTIYNKADVAVSTRTKSADDDQWDSTYSLDPDDYLQLDCGAGCVVPGFDIEIGNSGHTYFLQSGKSFAIRVDPHTHGLMIYEARSIPSRFDVEDPGGE